MKKIWSKLKKIFKKESNTEEQNLKEQQLGYLYSLELDSIERMVMQNEIDFALNSIGQDIFEFKKNQFANQLRCLKERYLNQLSLIYE